MHPYILEASLTGFLWTVLIVYAVYVLFTRYIFPLMLRKYVSDFQKQFTGQDPNQREDLNRKKEGEVSIKFVDKDKNTSSRSDDGEYVDYEEIK